MSVCVCVRVGGRWSLCGFLICDSSMHNALHFSNASKHIVNILGTENISTRSSRHTLRRFWVDLAVKCRLRVVHLHKLLTNHIRPSIQIYCNKFFRISAIVFPVIPFSSLPSIRIQCPSIFNADAFLHLEILTFLSTRASTCTHTHETHKSPIWIQNHSNFLFAISRRRWCRCCCCCCFFFNLLCDFDATLSLKCRTDKHPHDNFNVSYLFSCSSPFSFVGRRPT